MTNEHYMMQALNEAKKAYAEGEVPVGAIIVMNDRIIARGYNQVEKLTDSTAHAEILALTAAFNFSTCDAISVSSIFLNNNWGSLKE